MRRVRAFLPPEIHARIAGIVIRRRRRGIVDRPEALVTGPGFEERPVHGEMFVRQELMLVRQAQHRAEERLRDVPREQAIAVLGEDRRHPNRIVRREPDEPAVEQIVIQLLHELPLAPNGVEYLQQERAEELLGRNRGATDGRIQRLKARGELDKEGSTSRRMSRSG